ncbi:MAG TPA: methyltransferase domain-containing protein [Candidatus Binatia bacterium]|nr:methyltransferase domain-containing protein [Candidatus Binatia bacterium]
MAEHKHEHGHGHSHEHDHAHGPGGHTHSHASDHGHEHADHGHSHAHSEQAHDHSHGHGHSHGHAHESDHSHSHGHSHEHKTRFHDPAHAADFDRRTMSDIRSSLTEKLIEMLTLKGGELVLDVATGTGRVARPLAKKMSGGKIVGVDQALAMLDVGHKHEDPIPHYDQSAGEADKLPFKTNTFDRAFVSFSLHHFGNPSGVVSEVLRVLKNGGRFVVLDPIIEEAKDSVDIQLESKINQVFRRTHGEEFRYHTASSIQRLLTKAGYRVPRSNVLSYSFNQEGMDGIPTGRHWLEAALELEKEAPELAERMKKNYFTWHSHGDHTHVKGSFSYALITGVKPA